MRKFGFALGAMVSVALAAGVAEAQQRKNRSNATRPSGPGGPPPIGQLLPPFLQEQLNITAAQREKIETLQKDVDEKLGAILTAEQKQALREMRERGPGGFGPPPGGPGGGFGGPPGDGFGGPPGGGPGGGFGGPPADGFGGPPGDGPGGPAGGGRERSPIRKIMAQLGSPRGSLTQLIGQELKQSRPPWDKIQGQASDYAKQAAELARYDPPRGSKESWSKLTAEFAGSANAMDNAAQAKDKKTALAAQVRLASSCMACHREHRAMGPGPGGPGFGPGGPPPGDF
jgi:hypothetical protein